MSEEFDEEYEERRRRRNARNEEMRRRKKQQQMVRMLVRRLLPIAGIILAAVILIINGRSIVRRIQGYSTPAKTDTNVAASPAVSEEVTQVSEDLNDYKQQVIVLGVQVSFPDMTALLGSSEEEQAQAAQEQKIYTAQATDATTSVDDEVQSTNGIFIDLATGNILFDRDAHTRINPASMTKVLTVLVAAEHVTDWSDTFEITPEITNYSYVHDCSAVGFSNNEVVTVEDLFYGTVLCSGGDAALGLATYVAGSQEVFVDMMNEKLKELGLSDTAHFTNCVGLYDENHYCTVYDIAMILEAAIDNPQCREVLSTKKYTTSSTPEHPEGIQISNWFLRRIEDKDTGGEVICGKTGFVAQSGSCAVSYGMDAAGKEYICATVNAHSSWRCIYDHVELYKRFAKSVDQGADEAVSDKSVSDEPASEEAASNEPASNGTVSDETV